MVYTDNIHLVADSLAELHQFAKNIGLKRHYYHGVRKHHPHYDLLGKKREVAIKNGAVLITSRELLSIANKLGFKCQLEITMDSKCDHQCDTCHNHYK